jgi:hypothetical protein
LNRNNLKLELNHLFDGCRFIRSYYYKRHKNWRVITYLGLFILFYKIVGRDYYHLQAKLKKHFFKKRFIKLLKKYAPAGVYQIPKIAGRMAMGSKTNLEIYAKKGNELFIYSEAGIENNPKELKLSVCDYINEMRDFWPFIEINGIINDSIILQSNIIWKATLKPSISKFKDIPTKFTEPEKIVKEFGNSAMKNGYDIIMI